MRPRYGDDYAISGCVGALEIGRSTQYFGARINFPKALLYTQLMVGEMNRAGEQISPKFEPITSEYLDYDEVKYKFYQILDWLSEYMSRQ